MNSDRQQTALRARLWCVIIAAFALAVSSLAQAQTLAPTPGGLDGERTWRTVDEMSAEDRALFDPAINTPRDPAIAYVPAEPYPYTAPYTAEEMGFRSAEFVHISRWPYTLIDVFGVITSSGYINQGASVGYISVPGEPGLDGYIHGSKPGNVYSRWTMYDTFPPESEGAQQLWLPHRTDMENRTKMDYFIYSPTLRRVRRQPQPRRDQRFPDNAQTFDDVLGRDPWEFDWQLLGTDVLYKTIRFPNTRLKITNNVAGQGFVERVAADIKPMGDSYPHYRADGGIDCWVVKATVRQDWLPGYAEQTLVMWLDKYSFYPLRSEKYDAKGQLMMIEVRLAEMQNPARGELGYAAYSSIYWNVEHDLIGFSVHDAHTVRAWTAEEEKMIFTPEFMRRQWLLEPVKSQLLILDPEQFYLRPLLERGKFPNDRNLTVSPVIEARINAQEAAGKLIFESPSAAALAQP